MGLKQFIKTALRDLSRRHGWEFFKGPNLITFLESRNVDLVLDVGANRGEYGDQLFRWGYAGKVVSFEPTSDAWELLRREMKRYPGRWDGRNIALGAECGAVQINVSRNSRFSSILGQTAAAKTFDPNMVIVATETVQLRTLDSLIKDFPSDRIYLKIDTQGFEQAILDGAGEFLKKCVGVQLELPVEHLYEGTWRFEEAVAYMRERGFVPAQMLPVTVITTDKASVTEFDCVFRRG
jgi:FkbM family methyltransferase